MNVSDSEFVEYVNRLKHVDVTDFFSKDWFENHKYIIIINVYMHKHIKLLNVIGKENITDVVINKFEILLKDLITTYFVRSIKFDEIFKNEKKEKLENAEREKDESSDVNGNNNRITSYISLYHEMAILNTFEMILQNDSQYENVDNYVINLFAYIYSNLVAFLKTNSDEYFVKPITEMTIDEMLKEENDKTYYIDKLKIYLNVLNILRNITDRIHLLSNTIVNKIADYDILLILVPLMEKKPWRHHNYVFEQSEWIKCDRNELATVEKQLWIIVYSLILNKNIQEKYEMTNYRRNNILKLRKYMNEYLYSQIPPIKTLHTFIEHLYISKSIFPECKTSYLIIDVVPDIYEEIKENIFRNRKKILTLIDNVAIDKDVLGQISDIYFSLYEYDQENKTKKESWNDKKRESTVDEKEEIVYKCNFCNEAAELQCSQCKSTYYCSKKCQVKILKRNNINKKNILWKFFVFKISNESFFETF